MTHANQVATTKYTSESAVTAEVPPWHPTRAAKLTRRSVLRSLASVVALSPVFGCDACHAEQLAATIVTRSNRNPRWYGFNLLEYFSTDPDWMKYFPYKNDGEFLEDDFLWISDWGFNFVRLPMDYRFWTKSDDLMDINVQKVEPIDRAVRLGEKYDVHVNLNLHRAPGFCILDDIDATLTGIHVTPERTTVYHDRHTLDAFVHQWQFFAERYKGISSERVSFNLVNEPSLSLRAAEKKQLVESRKDEPPADVDREIEARGAKEYARVAHAAIDAIRAVDPDRLIVVDGFAVAKNPVAELFNTGVIQSAHAYYPPEVTTYKAEWARQWLSRAEPPTWPLMDRHGTVIADRKSVEAFLQPWREAEQRGVPIHFGEIGCYKHTPPEVVLAWFDETLDVIGEMRSGWALWNFRGPYGILNTQRPGTKFENWHGHQLDRPLLDLLQKKMQS